MSSTHHSPYAILFSCKDNDATIINGDQMNVVFLKDVEGVAQGGEVKEVKNGFARNYLLPKQLAVPANHNSLRRTKQLKTDAAATRLKLLADMRSLAEAINNTQITVEMRAGTSGKLYGSVTDTAVASRLSELTSRDIDRRVVMIADPIRDVGVYDIRLQLHAEVEAGITAVVYPTGTDPEETIAAAEAAKLGKTEEVGAVEIEEVDKHLSVENVTEPDQTTDESEDGISPGLESDTPDIQSSTDTSNTTDGSEDQPGEE